MNGDEIIRLSALRLGEIIRTKEISSLEAVTIFLDRIKHLDQKINSFNRVLSDTAIVEAKKADLEIERGNWRGPLHGVPFAIKDIFDTVGDAAKAGSKIPRDYSPRRDAFVVERLKNAGAILVGKLNMQEFAFGITGRNPHFGDVLNPLDLSRMCGGSSSGPAAALSAYFVPLTLGTDTGGSIRIPCSLCGTFGLKPTYGLISRNGVLPLAWSLDHVGPMSRDVEDIAACLNVIVRKDPNDSTNIEIEPVDYINMLEGSLKGMTIGIPTNFFFEKIRSDVKGTIFKAIKKFELLGLSVREIEIPGIIQADLAAFTVLFSEAAANLEIYARNRPKDISEEVLNNVQLGMTIPATRYIQALRVRQKLKSDLARVFLDVDMLVVPGTPVDAPPIEGTEVSIGPDIIVDMRSALTRFTRYFNLAGNPVLSVPCGLSKQKLPVGIQIVARPFEETTLLKTGYHFQKAFPLDIPMPLMQ